MQKRLEKIASILDKNKAEDVEIFDLRDRDYFADSVIIASSIGERHTEALLDHLKRDLKGDEEFLHIDATAQWIVADLGDILIHIMIPEYRSMYDIELFLSKLERRAQ